MKHRNIENVATAILALNAAYVGVCTDSCKPQERTMETRKQRWLLGLAMLVMSGTVSGTEYPVTVWDDWPGSRIVLTSPNVAVITVNRGYAMSFCPASTCTLLFQRGEPMNRAEDDLYDHVCTRRDIFVTDKNNDSVTTVSLEYNMDYTVFLEHDPERRGTPVSPQGFPVYLGYFRTHAMNPTYPEPSEPGECQWQETAFIPVMTASRAEGRDSKLWFANRDDNPVRVRITGWDSDGREYSGFEREIPAKRPTKVLMREIEDAIGNGEGHWSLTIESTGTVHVVALAINANGTAHDTLPVVVPESCPD